MFQHLEKTNFAPKRPTLVYDGNCGFCRYWVLKWKKIASEHIDYFSYQEIASNFKDIPEFHFKEAVRFIDTNGKVYSGPDAAFQSYLIGKKKLFIYTLYQKSPLFKKLCDIAYQWIADYRSIVFEWCKFFIGKNPVKPDYSKTIYLLLAFIVVFSAYYLF